MSRITEITSNLHLGDANVPVADLKALGITKIINITPEVVWDWPAENVYRIPIDDSYTFEPPVLMQFIQKMEEWEKDISYIHCHMGISRSPSFAIAWLMHRDRVKSEQAVDRWQAYLDFLRVYRPQINPHPAIRHSVLKYFGV